MSNLGKARFLLVTDSLRFHLTAEEKAMYQQLVADPILTTRVEKSQVMRPPPEKDDSIYQQKVELTMPELKAKAMTNPDNLTEVEFDFLTRAQRNEIRRRPPPDEEDRICREKVGVTMLELRAKALVSADTLTEVEVDLVLHGAHGMDSTSNSLWYMDLQDAGERQLVEQVGELLTNKYDVEVFRRACFRSKAFKQVRTERNAQILQEKVDAMETEIKASTPQWAEEMRNAKAKLSLKQWGFVIFQTAYGEENDQKWARFKGLYRTTGSMHLRNCWTRANGLMSMHFPVWISDPSLDRADAGILRQRFKNMKERNEIPDGIATDCFLIIDEAVLNHSVMSSQTPYAPKTPGDTDPWESTLYIRAADPDFDDLAAAVLERDLSDYKGEISIPLPKVFDWLYHCFFAKSETWETRYKVTKKGPAELMDPSMDYPAYRSGTEPPPR